MENLNNTQNIHAENGSVAANNINASITIHNEQSCISLDTIWEKLNNSDKDDWIYNDESGIYILKNDIALRIQHIRTEEIFPFEESWVKRFEDPNATKELFHILYNGNIIKYFYCALVDGARMFIPLPKSPSKLTISYQQYKFGEIVNICFRDYFNRYLEMANILVES